MKPAKKLVYLRGGLRPAIGPNEAAEERELRSHSAGRAIMCSILQTSSATAVPPSHICARRWLPLLLGLALLNLVAGTVLVTQPERARDLQTIRRWTHQWLFDGRDLYSSPVGSGTDYPPHAIVALSPLSLLPGSIAVPAWAALNLVLAVLAPVLAARFVRPRAELTEIMCLLLLFLCWSGTRSLLQFTLLTLVFGLSTLVLADRRPVWSGICLGLALMKPQIGAPFVLWVLFRRRWRIATVGTLVVACGSLLWCARVGADPLRTAVRYLEILGFYYTGEGSLVGVSQLRPLIAELAPETAADVTAAVVSLALLCAISFEGFRSGASRSATLYPAPAMAVVWSLLTFYHLTYGFVLLLPVAALLLLDEHRETYRVRLAIASLMQLALMVDVPGLWRRFGPGAPDTLLTAAIPHFYRLGLAALLVALWGVHRRTVKSMPRSV